MVQIEPSSQENPEPLHDPPLQMSSLEQPLPSSQGALLNVAVQLPARSQPSSVQALPSSHNLPLPGVQTLPLQASPVVQELPSSQALPSMGAWTHPSVASQVSVVQGFLSSQSKLPAGVHLPVKQVSLMVQALLSSHLPPSWNACWQPLW